MTKKKLQNLNRGCYQTQRTGRRAWWLKVFKGLDYTTPTTMRTHDDKELVYREEEEQEEEQEEEEGFLVLLITASSSKTVTLMS